MRTDLKSDELPVSPVLSTVFVSAGQLFVDCLDHSPVDCVRPVKTTYSNSHVEQALRDLLGTVDEWNSRTRKWEQKESMFHNIYFIWKCQLTLSLTFSISQSKPKLIDLCNDRKKGLPIHPLQFSKKWLPYPNKF